MAMLYDEPWWKSVASKIHRSDKSLETPEDLPNAASKVSEQVLGQARTRVQFVLRAGAVDEGSTGGLPAPTGVAPAPLQRPPVDLGQQWAPTLDSIVSNNGAAMNAVSKQANKFMSELSKHQSDIERRSSVMGQGGGGKGEGGKPSKQRTADTFYGRIFGEGGEDGHGGNGGSGLDWKRDKWNSQKGSRVWGQARNQGGKKGKGKLGEGGF